MDKTARTEEAQQAWREAQRQAYQCTLAIVTAKTRDEELEARERYDKSLHDLSVTKSLFDSSRTRDKALGHPMEA